MTIRSNYLRVAAKVEMAGERAAGVSPATIKHVIGFSGEGEFNRPDFGVKACSPGIREAVRLRISAQFNPESANETR